MVDLAILSGLIWDDLRSRVRFASKPVLDFNPLTATQAELRERALPPRPNPAETVDYESWVEMMSPPLELVENHSVEEAFWLRLDNEHLTNMSSAGIPSGESSGNWSGAMMRVPVGGVFHTVHGRWTVPSAKPPPEAKFGGVWLDDTWQGSTWIGLDGHDPSSTTLPQVGTEHLVKATSGVLAPVATAWWEWWLKDDVKNKPVYFQKLDLLPNDPVIVRLTVLSDLSVNVCIRNMRNHKLGHFDASAPAISPSPAEPIEHQTVEWIVERQANLDGSGLLPFADYGACNLWRCHATARNSKGDPVLIDVSDPLTIDMVDWTNPVHPGRGLSTAESTGTFTITASYVDDV